MRGERTELKQPEQDIKSDHDPATELERPPAVVFLVAVAAIVGDALVHFVFASLAEEREDEVCAARNAEP